MRYSDIRASGKVVEKARKEEDPWLSEVLPLFLDYAATIGKPFTTDDFFEDTGARRPDNPKRVGSLTSKALGKGWISDTGRAARSRRAVRHGSILHEWEVTETGLRAWRNDGH
jgi:hypothetical protein